MNYTELESRLDADLQAAKYAGFQIVRGSYGGENGSMKCCAVSAGVLLEDRYAMDADAPPNFLAQKRLGLNWEQLDSIIEGFDGKPNSDRSWDLTLSDNDNEELTELYAIGKRLAKKYLEDEI